MRTINVSARRDISLVNCGLPPYVFKLTVYFPKIQNYEDLPFGWKTHCS